ncbi:MAG TPA: alanine/glycine:cation symporter family protein [Euzebyales bacterium]|nr:alanine/glycine:cation symporter family protein [Euzebyales bacterium]
MRRACRVTALTGLWLLVLAPAARAAEAGGGIDTAINDALGPVSEVMSRYVFYPVPGLPVELPLIVVWLIAGAVFFTFYNRFINIRGFAHSVQILRGQYDDPDDPGETTHFQALMTALSATVGLGNIAGVAVAITIGGPGATFWMVVAAFFGMSTKFVECSLAVKYRYEYEDGHVTGGPMVYIERLRENRGWPSWAAKGAAAFFSVATIGGAIGAANMFQVGQAYQQFLTQVGEDSPLAMPGWVFGLIMAVAVGVVIIGGIRSIARVTAKLVPIMAGVYLLAAAVILILHIGDIPAALARIVGGALSGESIAGGVFGAIVAGIQRSAFSNEAGLGSAPIAHSSAKTDLWIREGFVAQLGPFIDTVVICTATALVIVITGVYETAGEEVEGVTLTSQAFAERISWFPWILMVAVILFAFSTIISWSYYGVKASNYLFGESTVVVRGFQVVFCLFIIVGGALTLEQVVPLMDSLIFLMPLANVLALYVYAGEIRDDLNEYWRAYRSGEMLTYEQEQLAAE